MKKVTLIATMMFIVTILIAQAPQAFKYQAVARDNAGDIPGKPGCFVQNDDIARGATRNTSLFRNSFGRHQ